MILASLMQCLPGRFVQKLRLAASRAPNITIRQGFVKRLINGEAEERNRQ